MESRRTPLVGTPAGGGATMTALSGGRPERRQFGEDFERLVGILSSEVYGNPIVFLRELISNSYDAVLRRESLDSRTEIRRPVLIETGPAGRLTIADQGIGMTRCELIEFLSNVGRSSGQDASTRRK